LPADFREMLWVGYNDGPEIRPLARTEYATWRKASGMPVGYVVGIDTITLVPLPPAGFSFQIIYWTSTENTEA